MKRLKRIVYGLGMCGIVGFGVLAMDACTSVTEKKQAAADDSATTVEATNQVVETIMSRRSVRKYKPQPVNRDTMQIILDCGIHAPNAMNKQSWEVRVVDNPEYIDGVTALFKESNPQAASDPDFKNMFRNAPTVVFVARDKNFESSPVDCGLLGENIMLSAWSMGIGSCCLGSPARFINSKPAAEYLKKLGFSEGYELLYCIGLGYPDEAPAEKPRIAEKVQFVD